MKAHETSLAIRQKLADANPTFTEFQSALADIYNEIGLLLRDSGKPDEALKVHKSALAIQQKLADVNPTITKFQRALAGYHNNIGQLLRVTGKPDEALKAYESSLAIWRKLTRDHPVSPDFTSYLGVALSNLAIIDLEAKRYEDARVRLREAIEWQRKSLASNPANPFYRIFLDNHLRDLIEAAQGLRDSEGVAEAERELAEFRQSDPAMRALDARLSAILRGDQQPRDNLERLKLAQRAYDKALHVASTKLWADALDADPKLAEDRRAQTPYNAACVAALAGCGQGKDDPAPDDAAKAKLRRQALGWLKAELTVWGKLLESGPPQARPAIVQTLNHWKQDSDLAGIRDAEALARLPEAEQKEWQALWADVEALLKRAQGQAP